MGSQRKVANRSSHAPSSQSLLAARVSEPIRIQDQNEIKVKAPEIDRNIDLQMVKEIFREEEARRDTQAGCKIKNKAKLFIR